MSKKILLNEKIFVAGATGMAGNAICRSLHKKWLWKNKWRSNFKTY